ncbi:MAG: hypothetical protein UX93_C0012G0005 [Microgenomates group bacterium GW2011_GWC1_47_20]|nr:MAG: hypothetical protein UX93_C0012G0005 [Microgenomates group bacterium GW2011_GWC1_47_20]
MFLIYSLFGVAFLLVFYLVSATDKLIKIREANAKAAEVSSLPSQQIQSASCGT